MKKNSSMIIKSIVALTIVASTLSTTALAAWGWETPGYEWAREKRLTSITSTSQLKNKVTLDNFYATLIKYLRMKGVSPKNTVKQNVGNFSTFNKTLEGIVREIDLYISKPSLTSQEYREIANYINHLHAEIDNVKSGIIPNNEKYLTRDSYKNLYLYFSLVKYKAATMISEPVYRRLVLDNDAPGDAYDVGNVKYKEIIEYNIKPYFGDISRREFLTLMFSLLSDQNWSDEEILTRFNEAGVLVGYEDGSLELEQPLTYAEMFTFLRRFEIFDFNPEPEVENDSDDEIKEYN